MSVQAEEGFVTGVGPLASGAASLLVGALSALPDGARRLLARLVGALAYGLGIRRRVALENLRHAFPELSEGERRRIARGAYFNMALAALEALTASSLTDAQVEEAVELENFGPVEAAIREGNGVLLASAHFGSWELFGDVLARRGIKLSAVVRPLSGAINAKIIESRRKAGMGLIAPRGAILGVLKALKRGEVVAQLIDQVLPARHGVFVPFFGRPAATTPALSLAAVRTGAPVFVLLAAREGGRLRVFVEGPVPLGSTGDPKRDVAAHVAEVTAVIERYIRRYPDQWLWLHRRWKVTPADGPSWLERGGA